MKINQKIKIINLIFVMSILSTSFVSINPNKQENTEDLSENHENIDTKSPKSAGFWNLGPIEIDESMGEWYFCAYFNDWCSGDGSWANPYLLENITINAGGADYGIRIWSSSEYYFIIRNCTIYNTGYTNPWDAGIVLYGAWHGALINNNISNNGGHGIYNYGNNNTIIGNTITNNAGNGIYLTSGTDITITENRIIDNPTGIYTMLDNLYIYYNYFSNTNNILSMIESTEILNSSKVGNYWNDYAGTDGNGDGIGDTPHNTGSGIDYLPICDLIDPNITIITPTPTQLFGRNSPSFELQINETFLESMWYSFDGGLTNTTFSSNGTINQEIWDTLGNGTHTLEFYAEDFVYNIGNTSILIRKDIINPVITINDLSMQTNTLPIFNVSIDEPNLDDYWYTMDGGLTNWTFSNLVGEINQEAWDLVSDGLIKLRFYANDTVGNEGYEQILIVKNTYQDNKDNKDNETPPPSDPTLLFTVLGISIAAIGIAAVDILSRLLPKKLRRT